MTGNFKIINYGELINYINSDEYKHAENIPISPQRAVSYANNKRAEPNSPAILILTNNNNYIAYRCLLADKIFHQNKEISFFWISGSWVHPDFRRKGLSEFLLTEAIKTTKNKLMFSNYAAESKKLYDKSNKFEQVAKLQGFKFYFRFVNYEVLPQKSKFFGKIKPVLKASDIFLNLITDTRLLFYKKKSVNLAFEETTVYTDEIKKFVEKHNKINPFRRNTEEFINFTELSWVIQEKPSKNELKKYYFSDKTEQFYYKKFVLRHENKIKAFFILKIRNANLSIPYFFTENGYEAKTTDFIKNFILEHKINTFNVYNEQILKYIEKIKKISIYKKNNIRDFYATKFLSDILKTEKKVFFEGDGDNAYT